MDYIRCKKCNYRTLTIVSHYNHQTKSYDGCYIRRKYDEKLKKDKWIKGCINPKLAKKETKKIIISMMND